jgi:uncharacterized protein YbjQ (UPF0145 family)
MIVTATDGIDGRRIGAYLGLVSGEAVMGTNIFRDLFASVRNIVGGRSEAYEKELRTGREATVAAMVGQAGVLGADAVVGVDLDYEVIGGDGKTMLMVSVNGTAVRFA